MRVLVTGGSGFIGRNLVEQLSQRHDVLAPSHAELDLADPGAVDAWFARHEVDAVVHGAVRPGHRNAADPSRQLWMNLRMFFGLMRNAGRFGRLVFLSSGAVYDVTRSLVHVTEDQLGIVVPSDEHGLSKYVIAQYLDQAARSGSTNVVELRLFGVFGRYEDYRIRFISNAICRAIFDLPITLRQDRRFSYLFIDDLMPVVHWALTARPEHVAYNVAPDWTDSLHGLGLAIARRSDKHISVQVATGGVGKEYTADNARIRNELPQLAFTPTDVAIDHLFRWYEDRRSEIDPASLRMDG